MKWQPTTKEFLQERRKLPKKLTYSEECAEAVQGFKELEQWKNLKLY